MTHHADHGNAEHLGQTTRDNRPVPISLAQLRQFHQELFTGKTPPLHISDTMRELFLGWLADRSGLADIDIAKRMAPALEAMFVDVEEELGQVAWEDLDPRYIRLFLFKE